MDCPLCNKYCKVLFEDGRDYFVMDGNSPLFGISICESCEIAYSLPYLSDADLVSYYPANYESFVPKKSFSSILQTVKYRGDLKIIFNQIEGGGNTSLFEIGTGRGEFLNEAKKKGYDVDGIEPGKAGVDYAYKNFNISLQLGYVSEIRFSKKYDVIVIRHVLEHVNDFYGCLKLIFDAGLVSNGVLFIKIPRMDSWEQKFFKKFWHGYDLPRHRVHFTRNGLVKVLRDIGYTNIDVKSEVVPLDFLRSVLYYSKYGNPGVGKLCARIFTSMPDFLKIIFGQTIGILMTPLGPGRMIVMARKNNTL